MKNYKEVDALIQQLIAEGRDKPDICWQAAKACVGWPYVFGARGNLCNPSNRRAAVREDHPTIKSKCQVLNGSGKTSCVGCKWYPSSERVRFFDCRGFTYWILKQVGITIQGAGATTQWDTASNWEIKGTIDGMPVDTLVCLFVRKGNKMEHTGFGYNNETVECSNGVQYFSTRNKKWTHWAVPKGLSGKVKPSGDGEPTPVWRSTLRRGDKGADVIELQKMLVEQGYDVGSYGIDGDFGRGTLAAVQKFQQDHGLIVDGVVGPNTWEALEKGSKDDKPVVEDAYSILIPHLSKETADGLKKQYPEATIAKE